MRANPHTGLRALYVEKTALSCGGFFVKMNTKEAHRTSSSQNMQLSAFGELLSMSLVFGPFGRQCPDAHDERQSPD